MQRQKTGHDHWILSLCIEDRQVHTYFLRVTSWSYMSIYLLRVSKPTPTTDITCPAISSTSVPITSCQTHYEIGWRGGQRKAPGKVTQRTKYAAGWLRCMCIDIYIYIIYIIYISYVYLKIKWLPGNPGLLLRALPENVPSPFKRPYLRGEACCILLAMSSV